MTRSICAIAAPRRLAAAAAIALTSFASPARAQTPTEPGGLVLREASVSSGYALVQLPPVTLGGNLPTDVLNEDSITDASMSLAWRRATTRTTYRLDLTGSYTARARYSNLSAPGANLVFDVAHAIATRWRAGASVVDVLANSDQLAFQPTQVHHLVESAPTFDDLAGTATPSRPPSAGGLQSALFVPIDNTVANSDLFGDHVNAASLSGWATYARSVRLSTTVHAAYTSVRRIPWSTDAGRTLLFTDSTTGNAGVVVSAAQSERTMTTVSLDWSRTSGVFADEFISAAVGYAWTGRKWFTSASAGLALRPFQLPAGPASSDIATTTAIGGAGVGYKFRSQTLLVQYRRAPHDDFGSGGRNTVTGFDGHTQSVSGSWIWTGPRTRWSAQSDFSMIQRPGNFSYIYAWLSTTGIARQVSPSVRVRLELLFDRHGSRGFEGYDLMREESRITVAWTPQHRRPGV